MERGAHERSRPKQEQQLFRWSNGKDPRQHGFDFGMWTRLIVRKLIADKFEANLGVTAVGKLLANEIPLRSKRGKLTSIQPLRNGQKSEVPRFFSGMSPAFVPISCKERLGV
jgi:hypothetical protein